jgi:CRISPR-associated Csx2 family protein
MHTLVTFLGSARLDPVTGYRTARYRFEDGHDEVTPFFGLALARHLKPDRLLILGTKGSMWPALLEHGAGEGSESQRLTLIESSEQGAVTQADLDALEPHARALFGREVRLGIIPYAEEVAGQQGILALIAGTVTRGEVSFDVTHGFRHLAMIGQLSAFMLSHARNLKVRGLWYGALEMTRDGITPVLRLDGMLAIERWLSAFVRHEANGDFSAFAALLEADGMEAELARPLERAWAMLNLTNVHDAALALRPLLRRLREPLPGVGELFRERLRKALRWAQGQDLAEQQRLLALQALARQDFLRASLFGLEAFLSRETLATGGNPLDHQHKRRAEEAFRQELAGGEHPDWKGAAYRLLKNVRNACAHGTPPQHCRYLELMKNPKQLAQELEATLNRLTNA